MATVSRAFTHVMKSSGGELVSQIGSAVDRERFASPLRRRDGHQRWGLGLFPLPPNQSYDDMLATDQDFTEYLQAAGTATALTIEQRKPGGAEYGCQWVRYVVGHHSDGDLSPIQAIDVCGNTLHVTAAEVFGAEEAADLFHSYLRTGDLPQGYALRPVEGYRLDGDTIDLSAALH